MTVEVKICGMTNRDDLVSALDAGADYVGFVLYDRSPRGISASAMRALLDGLAGPCRAVGVFVNESRGFVEKVAGDCGLYAVQLHGDEEPCEFEALQCRLWRAVRVGPTESMPSPDVWKAERYVIDANVRGLYGGTGSCVDREQAAAIASEYPVMLAGGLTPENVSGAVEAVRPLGVDVSSGVEQEPGRKDPAKVRQFIVSAKNE